jgi:hypothetical protein
VDFWNKGRLNTPNITTEQVNWEDPEQAFGSVYVSTQGPATVEQ